MRRSTFVHATAVAVALTAARPAAAGAQDAAATVRIGYGIGDNFSEPLYANDGGFLQRYGIDAELIVMGSGGALTAALAGGSLDVSISNVASIAQAHAMTTLHDTEQAAAMNWLEKSGVAPNSVNYTETPLPAQLPALKSGHVDATLTSEPWTDAALADDARLLAKPYDFLGRRLQLTMWIANTNWIAANKPVVARLVAAIHDTALWANQNRPATAAILEKYSKMSHDTIAHLTRMAYSERLDPALIQPIIDASARYGFLPQAFPASALFAGPLT